MRHSSCSPVAVHCGALIDRYLASQGALAQAVDRNTILFGSSAFQMSVAGRRLLLLHELAHVRQLASPGNDPVRLLEDEAWEAAHAWSRGRRCRIRGRARTPLNALAIIQGGDRGHPSAPPWYGSNPIEPIGNKRSITVKDVVVQRTMSVETVMDTMIDKKEKEVVIVCHGWPEGLVIPLMTRFGVGAQLPVIARLAADKPGQRKGINLPVYPDKDVATYLSEDHARTLRTKMNQVRALQLDHVAFRACDFGTSPDITMAAFRDFFGAKSISAPKFLDSYGEFRPELGGGIDIWADGKRNKGFRAWVDAGVAFAVKNTQEINSLRYQILARALKRDTLAAWMRTHVSDRLGSDNVVIYHAMKATDVADRSAPILYFVREPDYVANIVNYAG